MTYEDDYGDDYVDKLLREITWYEIIGMAAFVAFFTCLFLISDFFAWIVAKLTPKNHAQEVLLCLLIALVVSGFILWFILEAARIIFQ